MTSPPYWGLRDYGVKGQIGLEKHPQEYVDKLVDILHDLKRILKPHGSFYLNLGDTYCSTKGSCLNPGGGKASLPQPGFRGLVRDKNPNRMLRPNGGWLQFKQLLMIPARVAIALQQDGWILRNDIIWYKPNGLPNSVKDRLTNKYEHVFHFVKSRRYYYDLDAIRLPHKRGTPRAEYDFIRMLKGGERFSAKWGKHGTQEAFVAGHALGKNPGDVFDASGANTGRNNKQPYKKNNPHVARLIHGHDAMHPAGKNPGDVMATRNKTQRLKKITSTRNPPEPDELNAFHYFGKNPGDFWRITTKPFPEAHFAVYPEELCIRPILSSCTGSVCKACGKPPTVVYEKPVARQDRNWRTEAMARHMPVKHVVAHHAGGHTGFPAKHRVSQKVNWRKCDCNTGFESGIVFDPFAGAGTTLLVAKRLGRRWFGCDLNPKFVGMANRRLRKCQ